MNFEDIDFNTFKKAIDIYLKIAYPNGVQKKNFCYNIIHNLKKSKNKDELLKNFKKTTINIEDSFEKTKYIVRLGSKKYPFMKLILQETSKKGNFGFLIDRHTEYLALSSSAKTFEEEKKIKTYSRELKYKIENEYAKNEIPTYREIIKEITKGLMDEIGGKKIEKNDIKVLLIEDDLDILKLHKLNLEMLGYTVSTAIDGDEALYKVSHEFDHVMLLDIMLPGLSGFEIIKRVADEIPIIVLTCLSDNMTKKSCLDDGAKAIFVKPIEISSLDSAIKKVLSK
jgi:CheY-like chemotaxis protein